jgi:hypothetical protein
MRHAYAAHTSYPNTPETDKLPEVDHDVTVKLGDGREEVVRIGASDPLVAIDKVNSLDDVAYNNLRRV